METLRAQDRVPRAVALLCAARERLEAWKWQDEEDGWHVLEVGLKKTYRAARRAFHRAAEGGTEDEFHEWRKGVKHLGEHLALLRALHPRKADQACEALGTLADDLGDEHDLAVLAATLAEFGDETLPPADRVKIGEIVAERRAILRKQALRHGRRFFDERAGEFVRRWRKRWRKWREA